MITTLESQTRDKKEGESLRELILNQFIHSKVSYDLVVFSNIKELIQQDSKREKGPNNQPLGKGESKRQIKYKKHKAVLPASFQCSRVHLIWSYFPKYIPKLDHSKALRKLKLSIVMKGLLQLQIPSCWRDVPWERPLLPCWISINTFYFFPFWRPYFGNYLGFFYCLQSPLKKDPQ